MEAILFLLLFAFYMFFLSTRNDLRRRTAALEQSLVRVNAELLALKQSAAAPSPPFGVPETGADSVAARPAAHTAAAFQPPTSPVDTLGHGTVQAPVQQPVQPPIRQPIRQPTRQPNLAPLRDPVRDPVREQAPAPMRAARPSAPAPTPACLMAAKKWLFGGNLVAKLGLLILFIGISFLLKYAAERVTVPIELRLTGIVLADIVLLLWGWRIRERRREISLPVQGAALAILMLVTFGAFRLYQLIPGGLAFGLLFALTFFTCLLALLQNALWLAVFGIAGGFLAPIMTSTGQGSHIALFSYYALLNAGILGIALKRSWRGLNLLGFAFTFIIGTAWGVLRYIPEHYVSTQLFLILFIGFYVGIAVAYAARQAPALKNYVDATLVFGVPLVAFGLQYGLVKDTRFGVAFASLGFGLLYTATALALWRRSGKHFQLLVEAFLALGLVFGTLALPFALDGRWTSAAWALEGAGVVWVGLRQRQALTCLFGMLVQAGAWVAFLGTASGIDSAAAAAGANLWLGFLLLAGTAFLMARNLRARQGDLPSPLPDWAAGAFLAVATAWLFGGAWTEIVLRTDDSAMVNLLAASALACAVILGAIAARMQWQLARTLALTVQALAGATLLILTFAVGLQNDHQPNLFDTPFLAALLIFGGAFFSSWAMQRLAEGNYPVAARAMLAWSALWWYGPVLLILCNWLFLHYADARFAEQGESAPLALFGIAVALSSLAFSHAARRLAWPGLRWLGVCSWVALAVATVLILAALYQDQQIDTEAAVAYAVLWLSSEYLLRRWPLNGWRIATMPLQTLHLVRSAGPWLMIWPAGAIAVERWLHIDAGAQQALLAQAGWQTSGSWARYIPAWLMMLAIVCLIKQARAGAWPSAPLSAWYRSVLIPLASAWSLLLVAVWNLVQDGAMAPLPYLPLLNPLDLSTGFAVVLALACYRMRLADALGAAGAGGAAGRKAAPRWLARVPVALAFGGYAWFNLMLLRTAAHYLGLPYRFDPLFASQFIQAMLSLVWSISALILMWRAASQLSRPQWVTGAVLLGLVVGKLFLVDLQDVGGVARIISFVGVGLLMVLIGYLAPFPGTPPTAAGAQSDTANT